jgi:hypothetical protein
MRATVLPLSAVLLILSCSSAADSYVSPRAPSSEAGSSQPRGDEFPNTIGTKWTYAGEDRYYRKKDTVVVQIVDTIRLDSTNELASVWVQSGGHYPLRLFWDTLYFVQSPAGASESAGVTIRVYWNSAGGRLLCRFNPPELRGYICSSWLPDRDELNPLPIGTPLARYDWSPEQLHPFQVDSGIVVHCPAGEFERCYQTTHHWFGEEIYVKTKLAYKPGVGLLTWSSTGSYQTWTLIAYEVAQ